MLKHLTILEKCCVSSENSKNIFVHLGSLFGPARCTSVSPCHICNHKSEWGLKSDALFRLLHVCSLNLRNTGQNSLKWLLDVTFSVPNQFTLIFQWQSKSYLLAQDIYSNFHAKRQHYMYLMHFCKSGIIEPIHQINYCNTVFKNCVFVHTCIQIHHIIYNQFVFYITCMNNLLVRPSTNASRQQSLTIIKTF